MLTESRGWHEEFSQFFENPSREKLRNLLQNHVGELDHYDFKKEWPDFPKVARDILGMANSGGGCLIIGVEQKDDNSFVPVGIEKLTDKADIGKGIQKFLPSLLKYEVVDFSYDASEYQKIVGKKFQVIFVDDSPRHIPFVAEADGAKIRKHAIYARSGTNTEEANYEQLQEMFNRRLETAHSSRSELDLQKHLDELMVLYKYETDYRYSVPSFSLFVKELIQIKKDVIHRKILQQN
jgi:predicted HTH transcriptional regulator